MSARTWRRRSTHSRSAATTPPITSPCPPRYLVALCSTRVAPCRAGCCSTGVAKVLSTSTGTSPRRRAHRRDVEEFERRVRRRLDDHQAGVRADRRGDARGIRPRHRRAEQAAGEHVVGAAVERAHGDDVRPAGRGGREQAGGERRHAGGERDGALGALEPGEGSPRSGRRPAARAAGRRPSARRRGRARSRAPRRRAPPVSTEPSGLVVERSIDGHVGSATRARRPFRRGRRGSRGATTMSAGLE